MLDLTTCQFLGIELSQTSLYATVGMMIITHGYTPFDLY